MKALIVQNAYIKNQSQISQSARIAVELEKLGVAAAVLKNFNLASIRGSKVLSHSYDFCVFLDKDRVAARLLEKSGMRLFNSSAAIEVCDDKMLTGIALANCGINLPDTVYAPLCYYTDSMPCKEFLHTVQLSLGYPLVAKTNYGSLGAGVSLIKSYGELYEYERKNITLPHFYQKYIAVKDGNVNVGEDIRVLVVGGKCVCAMKRRNEEDFRSNIELGGRGENFPLTEELSSLCEKVAGILGLDYCGIDVLRGDDGKLYICEVNSNAFFAAAERVCGVNVAGRYAQYMVDKVVKT